MNNEKIKVSFLDHFVFESLLLDKDRCKLFLENALGKKVKSVVYINKEQVIKLLKDYKGSVLDLLVTLEDGTVIIVELQNVDLKENLPLRIRYYQSQVDRTLLKEGDDYSLLRETYILYLCSYDPFSFGLPLYKRKITFFDAEEYIYEDRSHLLLFNTEFKNDKINCSKEMLDFLTFIKEDNSGYKPMYSLGKSIEEGLYNFEKDDTLMEGYMKFKTYENDLKRASEAIGMAKGMAKGMQKGIDIGRNEGILSTAKAMLNEGMSTSLISKITGLSISDIEKLK